MSNTHIKLTTEYGLKLILPKKDVCAAIASADHDKEGIPYIFTIANSKGGWYVVEPLSYILDELGVDNG